MTHDILDDFSDAETIKPPTTLLALIILTLIFNGLFITALAMSFINNMNKYQSESVFNIQMIGTILLAVLSVINSIGVLKMKKLKRVGYYPYLLTNIIFVCLFLIAIYGISSIPEESIIESRINMMKYALYGIVAVIVIMTILFSLFYNKLKTKTT